MEKAGTVSDVLKAVGDIIQSTLSASVPQAGAAWMGVSILLKGLSNAAGESAANREGILYVGSRFGWYRQLFSILDSLAGGQLGELRQQLEAMAIDLFAKIFTYQMSSVGDYFRSQLSVTICNAFRARDWARDLGAIKDCEEGLRECLKQYDNRTEIKHLSDLARTAFSLEAGMTRQLAELGEIRRVQAELLAVQRAGAEKKELDEAYKLIGKFKVSGLSYEEFMDRNPDPAEGTCGWFLKDDRVLDWEKGGKKLLLVKAMPGQGKSVLARALVKKWRNGGQATVCHFFKDTNLIQKRADMALCAILHQILTKDPSLALKVKNEINQGGEGLPGSMTDLWNLLEVVTLLVKEPIICIFDALDECDDEHPQMLLDRLSTFCNAEETRNPKLKILATTRPIDRIINKFRNVPNIGLNPNDSTILASEIESVIKMRVGTMAKEKGWSNELRIRIEESLRGTGTPQNTYLWLRLIFELLDKEPALPDEDWLTLITELPPTVNGAYEKLLRSVDAKRKFYVRELLSIMICAATPLTAEEVNIALRVASGTMN
ncbi:hypothetical protein B0T26DRAFT_752758 [Lasiosphaeria miniovina]|uniref:NACHT domain-containing protein n=1 Tax=Lasiosphaeria miniovina TaxID=1954250 RepID=A0AA40AAY3_9PEZI|nr:uncharacterized protein B0T26DRAFT_752758 [Lasiosphaeria miniovina]KAK0712531.1 hypothetical protein B0T26DRAFT_752758 [Lasiosphaeria miniovina]